MKKGLLYLVLGGSVLLSSPVFSATPKSNVSPAIAKLQSRKIIPESMPASAPNISLGKANINSGQLPEKAKKLYLESIEEYEKAGSFLSAAELCNYIGDRDRALSYFEKAGFIGKVVEAELDRGNVGNAISVYERNKDYRAAAELAKENKMYERAAQNYEKDQHIDDAIEVLGKVEDLEFKLDMYKRNGIFGKAGQTAEKLGDKAKSGEERKKYYDMAGDLYAKNGWLETAAEVYVKEGDIGKAKKVYEDAGLRGEAARMLYDLAWKAEQK